MNEYADATEGGLAGRGSAARPRRSCGNWR